VAVHQKMEPWLGLGRQLRSTRTRTGPGILGPWRGRAVRGAPALQTRDEKATSAVGDGGGTISSCKRTSMGWGPRNSYGGFIGGARHHADSKGGRGRLARRRLTGRVWGRRGQGRGELVQVDRGRAGRTATAM
jgi:hypothetical protein